MARVSARTIPLRDRASGQLVEERVFGGDTLERLYGTAHGRLVRRLLRKRAPSHIYGWFKRRPASRREIPEFVASLGIDASEAERPLAAYASLADFFERRLRAGARPLETDPVRLSSPCDARVTALADCAGELEVKSSRVTLGELLDHALLARRFERGAALVFRLAPADYHRFHFPADGLAGPARRVAGPLESVHPIALAAAAASFRNQREITLLETDRFGTLAMIEVGAMLVGTIVQTFAPGPVRRGEEKGRFRFGGSTVVLLAEPGRLEVDPDLLADSHRGVEVLVRMGTGVARTTR